MTTQQIDFLKTLNKGLYVALRNLTVAVVSEVPARIERALTEAQELLDQVERMKETLCSVEAASLVPDPEFTAMLEQRVNGKGGES